MPRYPLSAIRMFYVLSALGSFASGLIFTVNLLYQIQVVGLSPLQLVLVGTTLEVVAFLFEVPTGIIADVYSRKLSIIIGNVLIGVGFLVEGLVPAFGAVLLNQLIWGVGVTFTSGATQAWLVDEIGEERAGRVFLRAGQVGSAFGLLGTALAAVLGSITLALPMVLGAGGLIILAIVLWLQMPETGFKPTPKGERNTFDHMTGTFREGLRRVRLSRVLPLVIAVMLVYGLYSEGYDRLNQKHILTSFQFPAIGGFQPIVWFSLLSIILTLLSLGFTEALLRRLNTSDRRSLAIALFWITVGMVGALVAFGLAPTLLVVILAYLVFNTLRGLQGPLYDTWSNLYFESSVRATMNSMMSQMNALGQIAGGPIVGFASEGLTARFGLGMALRLTMLLVGVMLTPALWFLRRARNIIEPASTDTL